MLRALLPHAVAFEDVGMVALPQVVHVTGAPLWDRLPLTVICSTSTIFQLTTPYTRTCFPTQKTTKFPVIA